MVVREWGFSRTTTARGGGRDGTEPSAPEPLPKATSYTDIDHVVKPLSVNVTNHELHSRSGGIPAIAIELPP